MWQCHYSLFINSHVRARFPADNNVSTIAQILIKYECAPGSALLGGSPADWLALSTRVGRAASVWFMAHWSRVSPDGKNKLGRASGAEGARIDTETDWPGLITLCVPCSLSFLFPYLCCTISSFPPARQAFIGCSSAFNWISDKEWRAEQPHNDCHVFRSFSSDSARYCPHGKVIDVGLWIPGEGPEAVHGRLRKHSQHE